MGSATMTPAKEAALLEGPAMEAPDGESYHLNNPPNQSLEGYVGAGVAIGFAAIFCALKLLSRLSKKEWLKVEDYLMLLALGHYGGFTAMLLKYYQYPGNFAHQWNMRLGEMPGFLHRLYIASIIYCIMILLLKAAILLQWIRLFVPTGARNSFFWIAHALLWINCMFYVACSLAQIFRCTPIERAWNIFLEEGHCANFDAIEIITSAVNALSDLVILILPQKVIWRLQMSTSHKLGISVVFAVGILSCTAATARTYYSVALMNSEDKTYFVGMLGAWTMVEISCGFVVLCLPVVPSLIRNSPFAKRLLPTIRSWRRGTSGPSERTGRSKEYNNLDAHQPHLLHDMSRVSSGKRSHGTPNDTKDVLSNPMDRRAITRTTRIETIPSDVSRMGPDDYHWQQGWSNLNHPQDHRG